MVSQKKKKYIKELMKLRREMAEKDLKDYKNINKELPKEMRNIFF